MHVLDLGVYQIIVACCLMELAAENTWGGAETRDQLNHAHMEYKSWCRGQKLQPCPRFKKDSLQHGSDCPTLTQHQAKAAQTRHLVEWLSSVLDTVGGVSEHSRWRREMFACWVRFEVICKGAGRYLQPAERDEIGDIAEKALVFQNALCWDALRGERLLWHLIPKNHMAAHICYDFVQMVNPRRVHNYPDEDLVGRCKRIISTCHGATAARSGMQRYLILAGTRWWIQLRDLRHGPPG